MAETDTPEWVEFEPYLGDEINTTLETALRMAHDRRGGVRVGFTSLWGNCTVLVKPDSDLARLLREFDRLIGARTLSGAVIGP